MYDSDDFGGAPSPQAYDTVRLLHAGDDVEAIANKNRVATKGMCKFAQSVGFFAEKMAKGPLSDAAIRKMEIGLPLPSGASTGGSAASVAAALTNTSITASNNSITGGSFTSSSTTTTTTMLVASPLRDGLFQVGESLLAVGAALEAVEAAAARLTLAKRRRAMLVEQRDRLLKAAAAARTSAPAREGVPVAQAASK